ncbi:MAG: YybS family protein [Nitrospirota bacterium]|nr:YybS family protein [Nitrospirota bacterium]
MAPTANGGNARGTLAEAAASLFLALSLYWAVRALGVFGMPFALFAPVPLAALAVRRGERVMLAAALVGAAFEFGLGSDGAAVAFLVAVAAPALLVARCLTLRWRPELAVGLSAALLTVTVLAAIELTTPGGMRQVTNRFVDETIREYAVAAPKDPALATFREHAAEISRNMYRFSPVAFMFTGMALGTASLLMTRRIFRRYPHPAVGEMQPITEWYLPDTWIWYLIAVAAPLAIGGLGAPLSGALPVVAGNLLGILLLAYALQGWAVMAHYFRRAATHPALQVAFYALFLIPPAPLFLLPSLALTGVFDIWVDSRQVRGGKGETPAG